MAKSTGRTNHGPKRNAQRLVAALTARGPQTRKQLADRLDIAPGTLRGAMKHLCAITANSRSGEDPAIYSISPAEAQLPADVVEEMDGTAGPKPKVLMLGPRAGVAVGVEIGRAHLSVGVGDANGCLLGAPDVCNEEHSLDEVSAPKTFTKAAKLVKKHLEACGVDPADVRGVGVSIPGPVGLDGRTLSRSISSSYYDIDIPDRFEKALAKTVGIVDAKVFVENDVDVLARGEQRYGKGFGRRDFMVIKYSGGIGCGIVADERLVRGRGGGGAGEIGHCTVNPEALVSDAKTLKDLKDDPLCKCKGFNHLEAYAGGDAIVERILGLNSGRKNSGPSRSAPLPVQLDEAMALAREGRQPHRDVIMDAAALVGYGVNTLIHLFNPERVLICGKLSEMGASFLEAIQDECQDQGLLVGDAQQIVDLGAGTNIEERRRISVGGAVTTALRKAPARFAY
jgi:predicted NBD/HSP70 family sugar kinase/DNA-binding CsgD family transcriptional regulator